MTVQLKKVEGGYGLFIPDELAAQAGLRDGAVVEVEVMAHMLVVKQPEYFEAARDAWLAGITPETMPDPHEPYDPPAGYAKVG
ncbi:MAG: hypothetical protein U0871_17250 [Gemmataceae bacterium]